MKGVTGDVGCSVILFDQGGGPLCIELASYLAEQGGQVDLWAPATAAFSDEMRFRRFNVVGHRNSGTVARLIGWAVFLVQASCGALWGRGKKILVLTTNPPLSPCVGLIGCWLRRRPFVMIYWDVYPEALERLFGLSPCSVTSRLLRLMNGMAIARAKAVVTLAPSMARVLKQYGAAEVIPTWVDTDVIRPLARSENDFAIRHGLLGKKIVMYSGNIGRVHNLTPLPALAERFREDPTVEFLVIGEGPGRAALEGELARRNLGNVRMLPFQARDVLPQSLASADLAIVSLAPAAEGVSMPSKTYYHLAAGSAVLALCDPASDLGRLVREDEVGLCIPFDQVDDGAEALRLLLADEARLTRMKARARTVAEQRYSARTVIPMMARLIIS